jgi:FkbM family methyltransferase
MIKPLSYSQIDQDLHVLRFFCNEKNLFFLDIGANDGKTLSNSYLLEKEYNWNGICAEPLPNAFKKLKTCRNVICDNRAVFSTTGLILKFSESELLSGITEYIDRYPQAKNGKQIDVNTITLQDLLLEHKAPNIIHYLSLDTEGTELEILKSVNLETYKFIYINLEHNFIEPRRTEIKNLLTSNGYIYKGQNKWDDDYIHESVLTGTFKNTHNEINISKIDSKKFSISSTDYNDQGVLIFIPGRDILFRWDNLNFFTKVYYNKIIFSDGREFYKSSV